MDKKSTSVPTQIVALIDMDCFYAQVDQRLRPELWGKPVVVCQVSNGNAEGMSLAVNYEARAFGVKRGMSAQEVRSTCPQVTICSVPVIENINKADLAQYRAASDEVFRVLTAMPNLSVEKASIDEAFLELSDAVNLELGKNYSNAIVDTLIKDCAEIFPTTFLANGRDLTQSTDNTESEKRLVDLREWLNSACRNDPYQLKLALGAKIVEQVRRRIKEETQFGCSAGIGPNKMLAKLMCSRHKPAKQTLVPPSLVLSVLENTPISAVRNLGGKLGHLLVEKFGVKTMGDLRMVPDSELLKHFPDSAVWLMRIVEGEDDEPVRARCLAKSIAVSKNFPGKYGLSTIRDVRIWIRGLCIELSKRLFEDQAKNHRTAHNLVVSFTAGGEQFTKTVPMPGYNPANLQRTLYNHMKPHNKDRANTKNGWYPHVQHISLSAGKFESGVDIRTQEITSWFAPKAGSTAILGGNAQPSTSRASESLEEADDDEIEVIESDQPKEEDNRCRRTSTEDEEVIMIDGDGEEEGKENGGKQNEGRRAKSVEQPSRPASRERVFSVQPQHQQRTAPEKRQKVGKVPQKKMPKRPRGVDKISAFFPTKPKIIEL